MGNDDEPADDPFEGEPLPGLDDDEPTSDEALDGEPLPGIDDPPPPEREEPHATVEDALQVPEGWVPGPGREAERREA